MSSADSPPEPPPFPADRKTWRFSMRTMMLGMTGFAFFCGLISTLPDSLNQALLGLAWIVATGWLVTGILFAKNDMRAFCVGAAVVASSMWTSIGGRFAQGISSFVRSILYGAGFGSPTGFELWFIHLVLAAAAIANGYFCIRASRYFERHADDSP